MLEDLIQKDNVEDGSGGGKSDVRIYELTPEEEYYLKSHVRNRGGVLSVVGFGRGDNTSSSGEVGSFQPLVVMSDERQDDVEESWRIVRRRWTAVAREVK